MECNSTVDVIESKSTAKWNKENIENLISAYKYVKNSLNKDKKQQFWNYVEEKMKEFGLNVTNMECKMKWKQLTQKYNSIKNQKKIKIVWPYYKEMSEVFKNKQGDKLNIEQEKLQQKKITEFFTKKK